MEDQSLFEKHHRQQHQQVTHGRQPSESPQRPAQPHRPKAPRRRLNGIELCMFHLRGYSGTPLHESSKKGMKHNGKHKKSMIMKAITPV
jgi:hypothetical protein